MAKKSATGLQQFALTVDILDDGTFQNIRGRLQKFFTETLKAHFFEVPVDGVRVETEQGRQRGLETLWTNRKRVSLPVLDSLRKIQGPNHLCI